MNNGLAALLIISVLGAGAAVLDHANTARHTQREAERVMAARPTPPAPPTPKVVAATAAPTRPRMIVVTGATILEQTDTEIFLMPVCPRCGGILYSASAKLPPPDKGLFLPKYCSACNFNYTIYATWPESDRPVAGGER